MTTNKLIFISLLLAALAQFSHAQSPNFSTRNDVQPDCDKEGSLISYWSEEESFAYLVRNSASHSLTWIGNVNSELSNSVSFKHATSKDVKEEVKTLKGDKKKAELELKKLRKGEQTAETKMRISEIRKLLVAINRKLGLSALHLEHLNASRKELQNAIPVVEGIYRKVDRLKLKTSSKLNDIAQSKMSTAITTWSACISANE